MGSDLPKFISELAPVPRPDFCFSNLLSSSHIAGALTCSIRSFSYRTTGNSLSFLCLDFPIKKKGIIIVPYLKELWRRLNKMVLVLRIKPGM